MGHTRRDFLKTTAAVAGAGALSGALGFPMVSRAQGRKLTVWWNRGYYKEEDEAMIKIAKDFEKAKNVEMDISFTIQEDLLKKEIAALTTNRVPDVAFCFYNDWEVVPKFGWEGKLTDCSDVVNDLKPRYDEKMLPVSNVWNNVEKRRAYFGVPIEAQTMHIHYWRDLLKEAGMNDDPTKIPMKWEDYWGFWKQVQDVLRKKDARSTARCTGSG